MATESVGSCPGSPPKLPVQRSLFREENKISPNTPTRPFFKKKIICYSCKQEGHIVSGCPNKSPGSSPNKEFPKCPQKYPELQCKSCGQSCVVRTSRTEANPGRDFYTCPRGQACNMFQWCDGKIQALGTKSPAKPVHQHGAAVSQNPECPCKAGPCRVETRKHGPWKGRKYFACYLKTGQGECTNVKWCDGGEDDDEMIQIKKGLKYNPMTEELQNTGMNNPTFPPPPASPTTPRSEHEANYVGLVASPIKSPNLLEGSPSKRKRIEEWMSKCVASPSLSCYLNKEPKNLEMNGGTIGNRDDTNSVETLVPESPPPRRREHVTNDAWLECSPMKRLSLTESKKVEKCVLCGEVGLLEKCLMCESCNVVAQLMQTMFDANNVDFSGFVS